jgi:hypothetical protein
MRRRGIDVIAPPSLKKKLFLIYFFKFNGKDLEKVA